MFSFVVYPGPRILMTFNSFNPFSSLRGPALFKKPRTSLLQVVLLSSLPPFPVPSFTRFPNESYPLDSAFGSCARSPLTNSPLFFASPILSSHLFPSVEESMVPFNSRDCLDFPARPSPNLAPCILSPPFSSCLFSPDRPSPPEASCEFYLVFPLIHSSSLCVYYCSLRFPFFKFLFFFKRFPCVRK